jgi:hypothetical protein
MTIAPGHTVTESATLARIHEPWTVPPGSDGPGRAQAREAVCHELQASGDDEGSLAAATVVAEVAATEGQV